MKRSTLLVIIGALLLLAIGGLYLAFQKRQAENRGEEFSYRAFFGLGSRTPNTGDPSDPTDKPIDEPDVPVDPGAGVGASPTVSPFKNSPFSPSPTTSVSTPAGSGTVSSSGSGNVIGGTVFPNTGGGTGTTIVVNPTTPGTNTGNNYCDPGSMRDIQFTAEELAELKKLSDRFYRLAPDLFSDYNAQLEEQNRLYYEQVVRTSDQRSTLLTARKGISSYWGPLSSVQNPYNSYSDNYLSPTYFPDGTFVDGATNKEIQDFEKQFQIW